MKHILCLITVASLALAANTKKEAQPDSSAIPRENVAASRVIRVSDRDIVPVMTRLRFSTMIVLPHDEVIVQALCGDKDFWIIDGSKNFVHVKPTEAAHGKTNLNLITASDNVYSFILTLGTLGDEPDLKLIIEPQGDGLLASRSREAMRGAAPRYVPAEQLEDYRQQAQLAKAEADKAIQAASDEIAAAKKSADLKISMAKAGMPASLHFDYKPTSTPDREFGFLAMWHDDRFTYIRANPKELPSLYEYRDGDANLIQMDFHDGLYTAPKILERCQLTMGKKSLHITHEEK